MATATDRKAKRTRHHGTLLAGSKAVAAPQACSPGTREHARDLPWRQSRDPYRVWVSEVMLQQTQVATVRDYFTRFVAALPDCSPLAAADEQQVLRLWEGLGYYRRARQLHAAAKQIVAEHGGQFPADPPTNCRQLPGIGRYTAGRHCLDRVRSAGGHPRGEHDSAAEPADRLPRRPAVTRAGQRVLWQVAEDILPQKDVAQFNQALMELGSLVCTPTEPKCEPVPSFHRCARPMSAGMQHEIPRRESTPETYTELREAAVDRPQKRPRPRAAMCRRRALGRPVGFPAICARSRRAAVCPRGNRGQGRRANRHHLCEPGPLLKTLRHGVTRYRITLDCYLRTYVAGRVHVTNCDRPLDFRAANWPSCPSARRAEKSPELASLRTSQPHDSNRHEQLADRRPGHASAHVAAHAAGAHRADAAPLGRFCRPVADRATFCRAKRTSRR